MRRFLLLLSILFAFYLNNIGSCLSSDYYYYYKKGIEYYNLGNYKQAAENFEKVKELMPDNPQAYYNLAVLYKKSDKPDLAIKNYEQAIKLDSDNPEYYYSLYILYSLYTSSCTNQQTYEKKYQLALKNLLKAIELDPKNKKYKAGLADLYSKMDKKYKNENLIHKAIEYNKKAVEVNPLNKGNLHHLAQSYLSSKQYDLALETYQRILRIDSSDHVANTTLR